MNTRGTAIARPAPGKFRCLVCKEVVTGTASGHCPRCGFVPPSAPQLVPERGAERPAYAVWLAVFVIAAIVLAAITR